MASPSFEFVLVVRFGSGRPEKSELQANSEVAFCSAEQTNSRSVTDSGLPVRICV